MAQINKYKSRSRPEKTVVQNVLSSSCCGPRYQLLFFIRWLKCAVNIRNKKQWDVVKHSNLHCYVGTITHDQGIFLVLPPSHGINLTGFGAFLAKGSGVVLCWGYPELQYLESVVCSSQSLCQRESTTTSRLAEDKQPVTHPRSWLKTLMQISCCVVLVFLCVILCLLWEIMQCLKVLAQIVTSTCQGIPHVEWMQEIKQIFFPYWKLFLFFFFCRIFLLLDSFPYVFVSTSLTRSVRTWN